MNQFGIGGFGADGGLTAACREQDRLREANERMNRPFKEQESMSKKVVEDKVASVTLPVGQPVFKATPAADEPQPLAGLTEGRMVHYVMPDGRSVGKHRPAIIVQVWDHGTGVANLQVFTDGSNDGSDVGTRWVTSVMYSEDKTPGTWHWIEKA
jgi:hypothetical protein